MERLDYISLHFIYFYEYSKDLLRFNSSNRFLSVSFLLKLANTRSDEHLLLTNLLTANFRMVVDILLRAFSAHGVAQRALFLFCILNLACKLCVVHYKPPFVFFFVHKSDKKYALTEFCFNSNRKTCLRNWILLEFSFILYLCQLCLFIVLLVWRKRQADSSSDDDWNCNRNQKIINHFISKTY